MPRRRRIVLPEARRGLDRLKYEVAQDLGLTDDVERRGWGDMTTREVGHIGGQMVRRMVRFAEQDLARERGQDDQRQGG
ncbi:MAG: alpha/beta-type small acid-soluble spore protein [Bacillota bacterium]|nr:alpha/beta-type small acid-soluble spore protein [Bacillota bacterium]